MKIGFLADLRNATPWERPGAAHYAEQLELIEEADRLGAWAIVLGEHHLTADGYMPQPLVFGAAIAARTQHIRIGTEVLVAPFRHPLHIAEEVAVLDQLSAGRVELGLGAGYMQKEYDAFGEDRDARFRDLDATVLEVRRLLAEEVSPRPVQEEVPIWAGYNMPVGARRAGRLGVGLMSTLGWCLEPYLEGFREGGHDQANARMGGLTDLIVAEDPERARAMLWPHIEYQAGQYATYIGAAMGSGDPQSYKVLSPDEAIAHLRGMAEGLPLAFVTPWLSIGGMPIEAVREHVRLTMDVVAPAVADVGLQEG